MGTATWPEGLRRWRSPEGGGEMVAAVIILRRWWCSGWSGWTGAREGEVGCCARPCRGGSNAGEKKGQHLAMEDYIAARQGGGWVTGDAMRLREARVGRGANAAVGRRASTGSGPTMAFTALHTQGHATGSKSGEGRG
jgi:hypothetical protein